MTDNIFITPDHYDHFSPEDIAKVAGDNTTLVIPEKMQNKVSSMADMFVSIITVKPGDRKEAGGTYTMDAKKAAELVNTIQPEVAIPVHYGTVAGSPNNGQIFADNVKDKIKVEIKIHF